MSIDVDRIDNMDSSPATPWLDDGDVQIYHGDARTLLNRLPDQSVHTCVTSPPYFGLRDYGADGQIGLEQTPDEYVDQIVDVFRGVRRVLRDDGTIWVNLGDSYAGSWGAQSRPPGEASTLRRNGGVGPNPKMLSAAQIAAHPRGRTRTGSIPEGVDYKAKDLIGIPWLVAFALRADGWYLRSDIVWAKPNPMPESVTDRPTKAHEYLFLLSKSPRYYYDAAAIKEPDSGKPSGNGYARPEQISRGGRGQDEPWQPGAGRNKRSVWTVSTQPYPGAHFAVFPPALIEPCILAGAPEGGVVLDPFMGSGTTAHTARRLGRRSIGVEINEDYLRLSAERLRQRSLLAEGGRTP